MPIAEVALQFVQAINSHDVASIVALMSRDHVFTDSLGNRVPRPMIESGWGEYFSMVPDYWIKVDQVVADENAMIILGSAGGTYAGNGGPLSPENRWEAPAAIRARVRDRLVVEWQVYCDNEPIREKARRSSG